MGHAITVKGQVTIPKPLRDRLGLRAGDKIEFALEPDGRLLLRPAAPSRFALARARFKLPDGLTADELMRLTRGERDDL